VRTEQGIERFTVAYANDPDELAARMRAVGGRTEVLLQRYVRGEGHGVEVLASEGRALAAFQHRRLREVPITGGASSFRESVALDPALLAASTHLLEALKWTGLAMVEFRVGPDGPSLMEVNGRIWGSLPLAVKAGMDFPARMAELFVDGPPPPGPVDTGYRVGLRSRNLSLEVLWIGSTLRGLRRYPYLRTPPRRAGVAAALGLLWPGHRYDLFELDDPRPFAVELRNVPAKLREKLVG
jgi:ATP-grasp in the biosynthetic pathway with Ter operon